MKSTFVCSPVASAGGAAFGVVSLSGVGVCTSGVAGLGGVAERRPEAEGLVPDGGMPGLGRERRLNQLRVAVCVSVVGGGSDSATSLTGTALGGSISISSGSTIRPVSTAFPTGDFCLAGLSNVGGESFELLGCVEEAPDRAEAGRLLFVVRALGMRSSAVVVASVGIGGEETLPGLLNCAVLGRRRGSSFGSEEVGERKRCRLTDSDEGESVARSFPFAEEST